MTDSGTPPSPSRTSSAAPSSSAPPQLRLLAEVAFTGVFYGLSESAKDIFDYIQQHTSNHEVGVLGNALALISDGKYSVAVRLIEKEVLHKNPDSVDGQLFAALALKLAGQVSQAERLANRATAKGDDEVALTFAKNLHSVSNGKIRPNY